LVRIAAEIRKKIQKKFFLAGYPGNKSNFLGPKRIFWLHLVPGTYLQKKDIKNIGST
jgi:hypothetical protein